MDKRSLLTFLLIAGLVFLGYRMFFSQETKAAGVAPASILALPADARDPTVAADGYAAPETKDLGSEIQGSGYKLGLCVSNVNAGLDWVRLADYAAEAGKPKAGEKQTKRMTLMSALDSSTEYPAPAIAVRPFATINVRVADANGGVRNVGLTRWNDAKSLGTWEFVQPVNKDEVRMRMFFGKDKDHPDYEVFKVFRLVKADSYDVEISHEVRNHTDKPITVTIDQAGPVNVPRDSVQTDLRMYEGTTFVGGDLKPEATIVAQTQFRVKGMFSGEQLDPTQLGSFSATTDPGWDAEAAKLFPANAAHQHADTPQAEEERLKKLRDNAHDLIWVAASDRFFAAIVRPVPAGLDLKGQASLELSNKRKIDRATSFGIASADVVVPKTMAGWENHLDKWVAGIALRGLPVTVAPNDVPQAIGTLRVYMGPKDRGLLKGSFEAKEAGYEYFLYDYIGVINFKRSGCAYCVFEPVVLVILNGLDLLHNVTFHNYGIAIIVLVVVVRLLLHPLTRYSQVNMAKMQQKMKLVQPELDRLKKKYAKEKQKLSEETMRVYKENKINPAGQALGCLPMLLQTPIWAALYAGLAIDIDLRQAGFIPGWITDLSNPDTLIKFSEPVSVPILSFVMGPLNGINLLPILLGVVFFIQQRMQQKTMPKPQDEAQEKTQMLSGYMILLFPLFLYLAPSGLNLYIFASTSGGIFDTWLVRRHLRATGILPPLPAKT